MWNWVGQLEQLQRTGRPVAVVTVVGCSNSTPREVGAKMLVDAERFFGTIGGGRVEEMILADARPAWPPGARGRSAIPWAPRPGSAVEG